MAGINVCRANEVLIVSGCFKDKPSIVKDGVAFVIPGLQKLQRLSLNTFTLKAEVKNQRTKDGIHINVSATAQVRICSQNDTMLEIAAELFLSKTEDEMNTLLAKTVEGHISTTIGDFTAENIQYDKKLFNKTLLTTVQEDLVYMGLLCVTCAADSVTDDEGYYMKLSLKRVAEAKQQQEAAGNFNSMVAKFDYKLKKFEEYRDDEDVESGKEKENCDVKDVTVEINKDREEKTYMFNTTDDNEDLYNKGFDWSAASDILYQ